MQMPTFLPAELAYCKECKNPSELLQALLNHSVDDVILFFETGCEHETWMAEQGVEVMRLLFSWLTDKSFHRQLTVKQMQRAAEAIQSHFSTVAAVMPLDVEFFVEQKKIPANSMLFGGSSEFFRELIWKETLGKRGKSIPISNSSYALFTKVCEFITLGDLPTLWREEPEFILELLRLASVWNIPRLAAFCADVYKRYLNPDNVVEILLLAEKEALVVLAASCCEMINQSSLGITLGAVGAHALEVEIEKFSDKAEKILTPLQPIITHVKMNEFSLNQQENMPFFKQIRKLVSLDLSFIKKVPQELIAAFPQVQELALTESPWLTDTLFIQIVNRTPNLMKLAVAQNPQLTFRSWGALSYLPYLSQLDLSKCKNLDDEELELIAVGCPRLTEIRLVDCVRITDRGLLNLVKRCGSLAVLDLSGCKKITEQGLINLTSYAQALRELFLADCPGATEKALQQLTKSGNTLVHI